MAESSNLKNTVNNFLGLTLMLIALGALAFSGALFFDAKFLADLMNVSEGARLGIASGSAAAGVLSTAVAANRLAKPMSDISKQIEEDKQRPVMDMEPDMMRESHVDRARANHPTSAMKAVEERRADAAKNQNNGLG